MPSVSIEQNRAMHAAAEGNSTLGIPKSVGEDFVTADHGRKVGELPKRADPPGGASPHAAGEQHAEKARVAFARGDHKTAMKHLGHALQAGLNAQHGSVRASPASGSSSATSGMAGPGASESGAPGDAGEPDEDDTPGQGIATPMATQPAEHYFGQVGPKPTPKAAPHVAPAGQLGATNHQLAGGFNKARFSQVRGR